MTTEALTDVTEETTSVFPTTAYPDRNETIEKCSQFLYNNRTVNIDGGYEGIPSHLVLNISVWFFLLGLFTLLRRRAWNYGRLAIVHNFSDRRWGKPQSLNGPASGQSDFRSREDTQVLTEKEQEEATELEAAGSNWLAATWKLKDSHILHRAGADALQYLSFQRHMIVFLALATTISLLVVLPINLLLGDNEETAFGTTTISNIDKNSPILWIHILVGISMLPLGIIVMRQFTKTLSRTLHEERQGRTIMITHISRAKCSLQLLSQHFLEAYPRVEVTDIQIAYDVKSLMGLSLYKDSVAQARLTAEYHFRTTGERMIMAPYRGGYFFGCCCKTVDALEFYLNEEMKYSARVEAERLVALEKPLGIAFVTFRTSQEAKEVREDMNQWPYLSKRSAMKSSVSPELQVNRWHVVTAPAPKDIYWENLSFTQVYWITKVLLVNFVLFVSLFFLTTPTVIVTALSYYKLTSPLQMLSPMISQSATTLLLWTFSALLPLMVYYSDQWLGHWKRSSMNYAVMNKCFFFLTFMVIILPSLGLSSIQAMVMTWANDGKSSYVWQCITLPDSGAFFVNYVITSMLIGTALELIRFPDLLNYTFRMAIARSAAEVAGVRRQIQYDFQYGVEYAWMLVIVALVVTYSAICPVITVLGLAYMVLKYFVDRHNIYFVYRPSKVSHTIHLQALTLFLISVMMVQFFHALFVAVWRGWDTLGMFAFAFVIISVAFIVTNVMFNVCQGISPFLFNIRDYAPDEDDLQSPQHPSLDVRGPTDRPTRSSYVPDVLLSDSQLNFKPRRPSWSEDFLNDTSFNRSDYGSIVQRRSSSDIIDLDQTNFGITPSSANLARLNNGAGGYNISPTRQSSERIRDVMEEDSSDDDDMDSTGAAYSGKKGDTVKLVI